jgi:hypothetical protein
MTRGGLAVIVSASTQKQRANRQSSFGPTCRLVSSPEAGPGATVGTMNQGYPLLQYKGTMSKRLSLVTRQTAPDPPPHVGGSGAATWPEETIYSKVSTLGLDPHEKCWTPGYTDRTSGRGSGPPQVQTRPLGQVPGLLTVRSRDFKAKNT